MKTLIRQQPLQRLKDLQNGSAQDPAANPVGDTDPEIERSHQMGPSRERRSLAVDRKTDQSQKTGSPDLAPDIVDRGHVIANQNHVIVRQDHGIARDDQEADLGRRDAEH